jgi:uncharacterized protein
LPWAQMIRLFKKELKAIGVFCAANWREMAVIGLACVFLSLDRYNSFGPIWLHSLVYYAALPLLATAFLLKKNPLDFGLRLGDWRTWGFHVLVTCAIAAPLLFGVSFLPFMSSYYTIAKFNLLEYSLEMMGYLFAWEYIFRGFMLFGLKDKLGPATVLVQMIPFALLHFGKPELEVLSTIPVGLYLGYIAYRGNSFWPAYIIHLFINIIFRVYVNVM